MNERLQELMIEAGYAAPHLAGRAHKLGELIIKECVEVAYKYDEPKLSGPGLMIGSMIEQKFGVEE